MNFKSLCESRFGIEIYFEKEKASHDMIDIMMDGEDLCSGSMSGPGHGYHGGYGRYESIAIFGWSYCLDNNGEWFLQKDGMSSWRNGPNPFPDIPEEK